LCCGVGWEPACRRWVRSSGRAGEAPLPPSMCWAIPERQAVSRWPPAASPSPSVLAGEAGGEQGPASPRAGVGDVTVVALRPPRPLRRVCASRGCGGACPFLPRRDEGTVCVSVRVFVHEGYYLMSILALSTHLRSWGPYIYSIPRLGEQRGAKGFCRWDRDTSWVLRCPNPAGRAEPALAGASFLPRPHPLRDAKPRAAGFSGRGNSQAAASSEPTRGTALRTRSHRPKPRRCFGFCRARAVLPEDAPEREPLCPWTRRGAGCFPAPSFTHSPWRMSPAAEWCHPSWSVGHAAGGRRRLRATARQQVGDAPGVFSTSLGFWGAVFLLPRPSGP